MATTEFVSMETVITADWANDVDRVQYDILDNPADLRELRTKVVTPNIRQTSSSGDVLSTDDYIYVTAATNERRVDIPTTGEVEGRQLFIKFESGAGTVRISTDGSSTIDGDAEYTLTSAGQWITLVFDGNNWLIVDLSASSGGENYGWDTQVFTTAQSSGTLVITQPYTEISTTVSGDNVVFDAISTSLNVIHLMRKASDTSDGILQLEDASTGGVVYKGCELNAGQLVSLVKESGSSNWYTSDPVN